VWGNTLQEWVNMVQNDFPGIIGEEQEWYPLPTHNSVPRHLMENQQTPLQGHPVLTSALAPILGVTIPTVAQRFQSVFDEMTFVTDFKLINLLRAETANLTHEELDSSLDEPENRWNIHLLSYDTLRSRAKPSSNGQLSHCSWSFGIFAESHRNKMK